LFAGIDNLSLEDYTVHVVAGVLKLFFRQLAPPVIAADFYRDFIRTAGQLNWNLHVFAFFSLPLGRSSNS